jgi:hypothetical protein
MFDDLILLQEGTVCYLERQTPSSDIMGKTGLGEPSTQET